MSSVIKRSDKLLVAIRKLRKIIFDKFTARDAEIWLKLLNKQVKTCNKCIKDKSLSIGARRKLQTNIGHFKHFRKLILNRHVGLGPNSKLRNRVKWENVTWSFASRLRTGIILNLRHKDLDKFLDDAYLVCKQKIKAYLNSFHFIKVNTNFCGEFIRKCGDEGVLDFHYFNTKNVFIDQLT
ncbi:unnamed protein product [Psylliodes chrysocephalus]|uniref:Uncharacterized protein n=1 Tax=Psylliodes chrysocephalus TaxID=3402493 RepID=A0A9P0G932_9CUCU|nr:unnamed protein product [Psylliodes chrysocephala]